VRKPGLPAAVALTALGADEAAVRDEVERSFPRGEQAPAGTQIPFTPAAKKALELALREALAVGHNYIGTEHLLLALVRVEEGAAARILGTLGVDSQDLRVDVLARMPAPLPSRRGRRGRRGAPQARVDWVPVPAGPGWEYRVERPTEPVTTEWLNELGAERWELVGPAPAELGGGLIFKRQRPHMYRQADPPAAEPGASAG
jgi:hypothetical protein